MVQTDIYLRKLRYRATHRGTREADAIIGGFFEKYHSGWSPAEFTWFELILDEQDVDIVGWVSGRAIPPARLHCAAMDQLLQLDFIDLQTKY